MRKLFFLLSTFLIQTVQLQAMDVDPGADLYPSVKKINNDLYIEHIGGKNLSVIMVRMYNDHILDSWKQYAKAQACLRAIRLGQTIEPSFTNDGSQHFQEALQQIDPSKNELWVAYLTNIAEYEPIWGMSSYELSEMVPPRHDWAKNIIMYMTVTSSPKALLTSHTGVSKSVEGLQTQCSRVSMYLHALGAKVMHMRNPLRRHMVNAPAFSMESILVKALPQNSLFVGTHEHKRELDQWTEEDEKKFKIASSLETVEDFITACPEELRKAKERISKLNTIKIKKLEKENKELNEDVVGYKEYLEQNTNEMPEEEQEDYRRTINELSEILHKQEAQITELREGFEKTVKQKMANTLRHWKNPTNHYDFRHEPLKSHQILHNLFKNYPPLLSVDGIKKLQNTFTIFDKDNVKEPWLTVHRGNLDYEWMFTEISGPAGFTHYIVANLEDLANLK